MFAPQVFADMGATCAWRLYVNDLPLRTLGSSSHRGDIDQCRNSGWMSVVGPGG